MTVTQQRAESASFQADRYPYVEDLWYCFVRVTECGETVGRETGTMRSLVEMDVCLSVVQTAQLSLAWTLFRTDFEVHEVDQLFFISTVSSEYSST